MKVLVTGGAGFIGSHTCKALALAGHKPVVYDSLETGHVEAVRWGPFELGDIRDRPRLDQVLNEHRPDAVIHFAALAYVGDSMIDPASYYDVNVSGSISLLQAMRDHGVSNIVFSSTCATYGIPVSMPISEKDIQAPINTYGFTKLAVERMLTDYSAAYGFRTVALRYFNAAGADPAGELGEDHFPETHALPLAILAALGLGPTFKILGTDFNTPDGTAIRDYVHVSDLASGHVLAAEWLVNNGGSLAVNLGTGLGTSVRELLSAVEQVTGRPVPYAEAPRRPGDPPCLYADATLARQYLNWAPENSDLQQLVATAAHWITKRHHH